MQGAAQVPNGLRRSFRSKDRQTSPRAIRPQAPAATRVRSQLMWSRRRRRVDKRSASTAGLKSVDAARSGAVPSAGIRAARLIHPRVPTLPRGNAGRAFRIPLTNRTRSARACSHARAWEPEGAERPRSFPGFRVGTARSCKMHRIGLRRGTGPRARCPCGWEVVVRPPPGSSAGASAQAADFVVHPLYGRTGAAHYPLSS